MNHRALVAMSGGVDSSVAALLMQKAGYRCVGATMKLFAGAGRDDEKACCTLEDAQDARDVARKLGMRHYVFQFTEDFARKVIEPFIRCYEQGGTPNPCIECNRYLKFEKLFLRAQALECDTIVTGHYARNEYDPASGRWLLKKARDPKKDQSYVLFFLAQEQLAHIRFPLGDFSSKEEVRKLAAEQGFVNARKRDSQDICFVPRGDYNAFIREYTGKDYPPGPFLDQQGRVLGEHRGLIGYTVGQRKGLGLSLPSPLYVQKKDPLKNAVILSPLEGLFCWELVAGDFNWIFCDQPQGPIAVTAKTGYHSREAAAVAVPLPGNQVRVLFEEPQKAVSPGQAVVLYLGDVVAGGGVILRMD